MVAKIIVQILLLFISTMLIGAAGIMIKERWTARNGPLTQAVLLSKTDYTPRKGTAHTYRFRLAFKTGSTDSVRAGTEVSQQAYLMHNLGSSVSIHYQAANPQNVVLASENWFQWVTVVMLAFGLAFVYVASTVKAVERKKPA